MERTTLKGGALALAAIVAFAATGQPSFVSEQTNRPTLLLVVGAAGQEDYGTNFLNQARLWAESGTKGGFEVVKIGLSATNESGLQDRDVLKAFVSSRSTPTPLWVVFIGHGTFDSKDARFNLRGPDVTAGELAAWLKPIQSPLVVINTSSSSSPFLNQLSATNRIIITATRSGNEQNFTRFGRYMAEAIGDPSSDLDKDDQVSVLEAFLVASRRTGEFYKTEGRILTEHALLDDNGDGLGTPADWFRGIRPVKKPKDKGTIDGAYASKTTLIESPWEQRLSAEQRTRRDFLESSIVKLRDSKDKLPESDYYRELEKLLLELADLYSGTTSPSSKPES